MTIIVKIVLKSIIKIKKNNFILKKLQNYHLHYAKIH